MQAAIDWSEEEEILSVARGKDPSQGAVKAATAENAPAVLSLQSLHESTETCSKTG